jgi:hypothetical protein
MQTKTLCLVLASSLGLGACSLAAAAQPTPPAPATVKCKMSFTLSGWSVLYKTASGSGTVTCSDGSSLPVTIDAKGGGLTVGHYKINDGHGDFTGVDTIRDVLGSYGMATAHVGAAKTVHGAVLSKGDVTLALGGTGNGWDIGVGFEGFTIKAAASSNAM